jgi:hypothetical protein
VIGRYPDPPQEITRSWAIALLRVLEERDRQIALLEAAVRRLEEAP